MAVGGGPARLAALLLLAGCVLAPDPASAAAASGPAPGPAPPNFLWIVAEDHGPHHGSYADPYAFTPNLDRLAAEGARFTHAFATAPICSPARTAIITGMYPTSIGAHHMRRTAVPPPHVKAFPEWLRAAGYFTTNKSKTDYNFSPWLPTDYRRAMGLHGAVGRRKLPAQGRPAQRADRRHKGRWETCAGVAGRDGRFAETAWPRWLGERGTSSVDGDHH